MRINVSAMDIPEAARIADVMEARFGVTVHLEVLDEVVHLVIE